MTAETINSILGSDDDDVEFALYQLVLTEKIRELGEDQYTVVDELNVKRLKR